MSEEQEIKVTDRSTVRKIRSRSPVRLEVPGTFAVDEIIHINIGGPTGLRTRVISVLSSDGVGSVIEVGPIQP